MSTFELEEKKRNTTYDLKIIRWLLGYVYKSKKFFILSLFFMIIAASLEVSVPYLTKKAVDSYIYPNWGKVEVNNPQSFKKELGELRNRLSNKIINIDQNSFFLDLSEVGLDDRDNLKKFGLISEAKYVVINSENYNKAMKKKLFEVINSNPDQFKKINNLYITNYSELDIFDKKEIQVLRFEQINKIKKLIFYIFLCIIGIFASTTSFTYMLHYSGHNIMHSIRKNAFNHILKLPQKYFDTNPVGRVTTRVTNDVNAINEMYTSVLVQFIKDLIVIVAILVILFQMNVGLTFIILGLTIFLGVVAALFRMRLKTVFREIRITIGKLNAFVQESMRGIILLKLYGKEKDNYERFENINKENYKANMDQLWTYVMFRPFIEYVSIMGVGVIIWYGGINVLSFNLTLGALIAYLYYVRMIFKPIQELSEKYNIFQSAAAASENLYDIIQEPIEENGAITPGETRGVVEFKNVWFSYNQKDWVLKNVSFKIRPGETVALVGLTGSGKTTIVNLLLKFYQVQRGEILFNGININNLENSYIRENITAVFQDLFLFGKDISDEKVDFSKIEENYGIRYKTDSLNKLSSGETQIVSIAKALEKNSRLLVMDEATSHIDAAIEKTIQNKIREDTKSQTKLIIAHRLSNVRNADKIIVIHKGEIVEQGKHIELLNNKKIYFTLHNFQNEIDKLNPSLT